MAQLAKEYVEWNRRQMVGDGLSTTSSAPEPASAGLAQRRWNKWQWVGAQVDRSPLQRQTAAEMEEGESGLSGHRHNPGVQHWAPSEPQAHSDNF